MCIFQGEYLELISIDNAVASVMKVGGDGPSGASPRQSRREPNSSDVVLDVSQRNQYMLCPRSQTLSNETRRLLGVASVLSLG